MSDEAHVVPTMDPGVSSLPLAPTSLNDQRMVSSPNARRSKLTPLQKAMRKDPAKALMTVVQAQRPCSITLRCPPQRKWNWSWPGSVQRKPWLGGSCLSRPPAPLQLALLKAGPQALRCTERICRQRLLRQRQRHEGGTTCAAADRYCFGSSSGAKRVVAWVHLGEAAYQAAPVLMVAKQDLTGSLLVFQVWLPEAVVSIRSFRMLPAYRDGQDQAGLPVLQGQSSRLPEHCCQRAAWRKGYLWCSSSIQCLLLVARCSMNGPLQFPSTPAPGMCAATWAACPAGRARYKRKKADQAAAAAEQSHDVPQSREDADKEAKRLKRLLRNRVSAQQARERKKNYVQTLEERNQLQEQQVQQLQQRVKTLERESLMLRQSIEPHIVSSLCLAITCCCVQVIKNIKAGSAGEAVVPQSG
eukprot:jgi/Astpho2/6854/fgenesh1_pg.00105_%23_28_t